MTASYTILDFETTQSPTGLRAVEVAILRVEATGAACCESHLVQPGCRIDGFSRSIHHISDAMVRTAPAFAELWPRLAAQLDGTLLLAHNASFDAGVLRNELQRHGLSAPRVRWLCSRQLARRVWPQFARFGLSDLWHELGIPVPHTHRAEGDVRLTAEVVARALGDLCTRLPAVPPTEHLVRQAHINLKTSWPFEAD
ncbi:MAG: 3'-5' exonuclease [Candidatus Sumerlaeia bacterium]|nr:3'-5' exonuclease [Candidatus Sumerlaeia bacterium]